MVYDGDVTQSGQDTGNTLQGYIGLLDVGVAVSLHLVHLLIVQFGNKPGQSNPSSGD